MAVETAKSSIHQLMISIRMNDVQKVQQQLENGVPINKHIKFYENDWQRCYTPVCLAIASGAEDVLQALIQAGADIRKVSYCHGIDMFEKFTALFLACREGRLNMVEMLIAAGVDVNESTLGTKLTEEEGGTLDYVDSRDTCLHWATLHRRKELMSKLIDCGANPLKRNIRLETPLHLASDSYNPTFIQHLVRAGGITDSRDAYGTTPMASILMNNQGDVDEKLRLARLFLSAGYQLSNDSWIFSYSVLMKRNQLALSTSQHPVGDMFGPAGERHDAIHEMLLTKYGKDFMNVLAEWSYRPKSLRWLCRIAVRRAIGSIQLLTKLQSLELPHVLHSYLMLDQ